MKNKILVIEETHLKAVLTLFKNHRIDFYEAGMPGGKVTMTETFESESNIQPKSKRESKGSIQKEHNNLVKYAKQLGCNSIGEAVAKVGSGLVFRRKFKKEFVIS